MRVRGAEISNSGKSGPAVPLAGALRTTIHICIYIEMNTVSFFLLRPDVSFPRAQLHDSDDDRRDSHPRGTNKYTAQHVCTLRSLPRMHTPIGVCVHACVRAYATLSRAVREGVRGQVRA